MSRTPDERMAELLTDFTAQEPGAAPWLAEPAVRAVLAAWKTLPARLTIPLTIGGVPQHAHNRWRYLWKFRDLNAAANDLAQATGLPGPEAAAALDRLAGARHIYPNGRLSAAAEAAIAAPSA